MPIKRSKKSRKVRISLDLHPEENTRLVILQNKINASNKVTVIKQALQLYEWLLENIEDGQKVFLGKSLDTAVEQQIISLRH